MDAASGQAKSALDSLDAGDRLTIREIELVPIVVPLAQLYRGSFYEMTNRATIITRVITEEGIVGEAYAGDEDKTLAEIAAIVEREIAPRLVGEDAFAFERCWELGYPVTYDQLRDRRVGLVALASVDLAIWDAIGKALAVPLWRLWGGYRNSDPGQHHRRLLRPRPRRHPGRGRGVAGHGLSRLQVQGRRAHPARGRRAGHGGARGGRRRLRRSRSTPTRDTACRWRSSSASASPTSTSAGSRSRASGPTTAATCARCARAAGSRCAPARASTRPRPAGT